MTLASPPSNATATGRSSFPAHLRPTHPKLAQIVDRLGLSGAKIRYLHLELLYDLLEDAVLDNDRDQAWQSIGRALSQAEKRWYQSLVPGARADQSPPLESLLAPQSTRKVVDELQDRLMGINVEIDPPLCTPSLPPLLSPSKSLLIEEYQRLSALFTTYLGAVSERREESYEQDTDLCEKLLENLRLKLRVIYLECCQLAYDAPMVSTLRSRRAELEKEKLRLERDVYQLEQNLKPYTELGDDYKAVVEEFRDIRESIAKAKDDIKRINTS